MNIEIADKLVELRKKNSLSQEALAEKLGVSRQAVSKWERAEASPDTDNLIQLAKLYGISLDQLLGTGNAAPAPPPAPFPSAEIPQEISREQGAESQPVYIVEEEPVRMNYKMLFGFPLYLIVLLTYLIMGAFWGGWHPGWLLFFLPPIWHSVVIAVQRRDARRFAYPVFVTFLYLCLGIFFDLWHPAWILFTTIPLYYPLIGYFRKVYRAQNRELDDLIRETGGKEKKDR